MLSEALAGQGQVYFVDAAHFVYGAFLAVVWSFCRTFIKSLCEKPFYPGANR